METEEIRYSVGNILGMDIELSKPFPMYFIDFKVNKMTMMTGMNGTGKSVIMKINWIMSTIANYCCYKQDHQDKIDLENEINFLFEHTFSDNNFTGDITTRFENLDMKLELNEGKYVSFSFTTSKLLSPSNLSFYLSSETRLLSDHVKYMKMRKALGVISPLGAIDNKGFDTMLKVYKIYDVLFMEYYLRDLNGYKITEEEQASMDKMESNNLKYATIEVDQDACTIKNVDGEESKDLTILSAGQQAIFVMFTSSKVLTN